MRRHHWKLSSVQKERLHQYLAQEPVLQALYFAKQQLNGFLVMKNMRANRAKRLLPKFLALIRQFEQSPAKALAATLTLWLERSDEHTSELQSPLRISYAVFCVRNHVEPRTTLLTSLH